MCAYFTTGMLMGKRLGVCTIQSRQKTKGERENLKGARGAHLASLDRSSANGSSTHLRSYY